MSRRTDPKRDALADEINALTDKVADLEIEIKALTKQRGSLTQVTDLEREIEKLKLEKARLVEEGERRVRDVEHKVGLVQKRQEQDAAHQKRQIELARQEAVLEVREQNLDHATSEFDKRMAFREEQFDKQVAQWQQHLTDFKDMYGDAMKRVPNIDVALSGAIGRPAPASSDDDGGGSSRRSSRSRKADDD